MKLFLIHSKHEATGKHFFTITLKPTAKPFATIDLKEKIKEGYSFSDGYVNYDPSPTVKGALVCSFFSPLKTDLLSRKGLAARIERQCIKHLLKTKSCQTIGHSKNVLPSRKKQLEERGHAPGKLYPIKEYLRSLNEHIAREDQIHEGKGTNFWGKCIKTRRQTTPAKTKVK